jgi:serine/threonine protein kinase
MTEMGVGEGQVLGRYELLLRVAQGGMARVWAARLHGSRGFRKLVAVKTILPGVMDGDRLEQMFLEEATLASGIHHPNVVDTLELGEQDGVLFMVLEWVDGEPLSLLMQESVKTGGIPLPIAVSIVAQACKGIHAAHELTDETGAPLGVVHRDISPHNVLVTYSGIAKVVDFGIAKATHRSSALTETGEVKGKLAYMSPEQVRGRAVDRRTDVFALGTILYALTTGTHPWKGDHPGATTERLISERPAKPPSAYRDDYPEALEAVVLQALQKDPEKRFPSAERMLAALEDAVPTSLEGNSEARIADFMKILLGPRGIERRKQIRLAGDLLDQRRALAGMVTSTTGTSGSTSAVAVAVDAGSGVSQVGPLSRPGTPPATPSLRAERRRFDKFVWATLAVAFAGGLGFLMKRGLGGGDTAAARAASAGLDAQAPRAALEVQPPNPVHSAAPVAVESPAPGASGDAAREDEAGSRGKEKASGHVVSRASGVRIKSGAPLPASVDVPPSPQPAKSAAVATTTTTPPPASAPAPATSSNAWNPATFGNRY